MQSPPRPGLSLPLQTRFQIAPIPLYVPTDIPHGRCVFLSLQLRPCKSLQVLTISPGPAARPTSPAMLECQHCRRGEAGGLCVVANPARGPPGRGTADTETIGPKLDRRWRSSAVSGRVRNLGEKSTVMDLLLGREREMGDRAVARTTRRRVRFIRAVRLTRLPKSDYSGN
jgi:hypothetical protein